MRTLSQCLDDACDALGEAIERAHPDATSELQSLLDQVMLLCAHHEALDRRDADERRAR
jgi:hypothetical protein